MKTSKSQSSRFNLWWLLVAFIVFVVLPFCGIVACCLIVGRFWCDSPFINELGTFYIYVISVTLITLALYARLHSKLKRKKETEEDISEVNTATKSDTRQVRITQNILSRHMIVVAARRIGDGRWGGEQGLRLV